MRRRDLGRGLAGATLGLGLGALTRPAEACLWDSDTLAAEAAGAPDAVATLVGGFVQNPAKYFEMRIARVTEGLKATPDDLSLYDDVAVASDRLGKPDDAIAWMAKKKAALERVGESTTAKQPNHHYRYHANLGTFHAHRWLKAGAPFDALDDLEKADALITKAIADNPKAHFGRERYQQRAIAWLLKKPTMPTTEYAQLPILLPIDHGAAHATGPNDYLKSKKLEDAVAGLCGLITLGAAWNSFDVTTALLYALGAEGHQSLKHMAYLRAKEIVAAGGRSLVAGAPTGEALISQLPQGQLQDTSGVESQFADLRRDAKAWAKRREDYLLARLARGEHPDSSASFWQGFDGNPNHMGKKGEPLKGLPSRGCACGVSGSRGGGAGGLALLGLGLAARLARR